MLDKLIFLRHNVFVSCLVVYHIWAPGLRQAQYYNEGLKGGTNEIRFDEARYREAAVFEADCVRALSWNDNFDCDRTCR